MRNITALFFLTIFWHHNCAQDVHVSSESIFTQFNIKESSLIYNKITGKNISYQEYLRLIKEKPDAYRLDPMYNEFGEIGSFSLRLASTNEKLDGRIYETDTTQRPKVGTPIPLFVMNALDGKTYRSIDMKGSVVILGFWLKLRRPFWNADWVTSMNDVLKHYQKRTDLIALGVVDEAKADLEKFISSQALPFVPVPKSYGFNKKFVIVSTPSFVVIDKSGTVAGIINGPEFDELAKVLSKVMK